MSKDYQCLVDGLVDFIECRFGVYLDTIMGFQNNLNEFVLRQHQSARVVGRTIAELDQTYFIRANGPPSSDLEEWRKRELHRMTQGEFKKNNDKGGLNYQFAIENCLSDIFNHWDNTKRELGFKKNPSGKEKEVDDMDVFPVMAYMREIRNCVQHELYPDRNVTSKKEPISMNKATTTYLFPTFRLGQPVQLTDSDIDALVIEARVQLNAYLVPYINNFLITQTTSIP